MADDHAACLLMNLPLEVRHTIFEYSASRDVKPKKLLRYWFEKKEAKELVAKQAEDDPNAPAARVVYGNEYDEDSDVPEPEDEDSSDDEDEDGEDNEDNEDGGEDEGEDEDGEDIVEEADEVENEEEDEDDEAVDGGIAQPNPTSQALPPQPPTATTAQNQGGNTIQQPDEAETEDEDDDQDDQEGETATQAEGGDEAIDEDDAEDAEQANATVATPRPPTPVIRISRKWRYIPNFMRITHCPPPIELLLASKQLNEEAKDWFYDVAVLRINATGSFAHTSFFEEAFSQVTDAAFSPMENVRKVEAMFVWDTTWLRAEETGCAEAIFPALLRQRSDFVYKASAPSRTCDSNNC
jgi:hypothetical protein